MRRAALLFIAAALVLAAQVFRDPNASNLIPISRVINLASELAARALKSGTFTSNRAAKINSSGAIESVSGTTTDCVTVAGSGVLCDAADLVHKGSPFTAGVPKINAGGTLETISGSSTDCIRGDGSVGTCGSTAASRFTQQVRLLDDFIGGERSVTAASNNRIGSLGWGLGGTSPSSTLVASGSGSIGYIWLRTLSGSTGDAAALYLLPSESGSGWMYMDSTADMIVSVKVDGSSLNDTRFGFGAVQGAGQPTDGAYIERLTADSSWYCVSRASGTQTRSGIVSYAQDTWVWFRIRKTVGGWVCSAAGSAAGLEVVSDITVSTNIPGTVNGYPFFQITHRGAGGSLFIDRADIVITY